MDFGIGLDGGADAAHVHVDGAVKGFELAAAHGFHDLVAAEHAAGALGQGDQQVKLVAGQVGRLAADGDGAGIAVDLQAAKAQHLAGGGGGAAPSTRRRKMARMRASSSRGSKGLGR